ncbi:hypothetical protein M407DRAFT_20513 [Tulasnella calospora MUT 4182]|uniref:F-box domain-containing protein n=1 Tax=Tulasnella calospora MUT 4182 TaxID=1051891 RepID=A0A0C3L9D1_9AGAM|nr:hypothetical protein M407DRAFT_20513 [Tulasnella calospora MUT 4182]
MSSPNLLNLIALPSEILDLVASQMRKKKHLLNLALTHTILCDIVIPRHLYRQISVYGRNSARWSHLLADPQRLRSIRNLRIISHTTYQVSGHLVLTKGGEPLYKAITEMPGLKQLAVCHQPNPAKFQSKAFDEMLWGTVIRVCLAMEDFCFSGGWNCLYCYETAFGKSESNIWFLGSLESVDLELRCSPGGGKRDHKYDFSPVYSMLLRCPTLKRLSLTYDNMHCNILEIPELLSLRFPHLKTLRLTSIAFGVQTASLLSSFISANPSIIDFQYLPSTALTLDSTLAPCSMDVLNCLTSLEGTLKTCERLIGAATPTKLKHLSVTLETAEFGALVEFICWPGSFLENLCLYFKDVGQFDWVLLTDSIRSSCTHLRRLRIQQPEPYGHADSSRILSMSDIASTLTGYHELSVFDIPCFIAAMCGLSYYRHFNSINQSETRESVFGRELKWPRFIRTTGSGVKLAVVNGSNPTESEKDDLQIKIKSPADEQKTCRTAKWTVWIYDELTEDECWLAETHPQA